MKKNLLTFCMLILTLGIFTSTSVAQEVVGGESDGYFNIETGMPLLNVPISQPRFVLHVTRNNGNGTTADGKGETRLHITDKNLVKDARLMSVSAQGLSTLQYKVVAGDGVESENYKHGYFSFPLLNNIPPKGKMIFEFVINGETYFIPSWE